MISFRHMAVAFIENNGRILMQKRERHRLVAGGVYAPVGGHLKDGEYQNPVDGCIREIEEETGLKADQLDKIKLKYMIMRQKDQEIRVQYVYFMSSKSDTVVANDEGTLHWICQSKLLDLQMSFTSHEIIKHYLTKSTFEDPIYVGTVDGQPTMHFVKINDFE
ncbi:NUDIX domain-containing protein [Acidaminobacter sp. JC074]|uniref:NUDIX domain-containing protein n=1 Tax=Acidaminobacter sp. JC074 TaxID=2530199 RepID=UPI001F10BA77|nr:NUDIX domain-containing protein [Acidaminobacter sp. JC074]MCH4886115.1 NUDIX domain-containing protein [Acidaminobacter sp. JC074]